MNNEIDLSSVSQYMYNDLKLCKKNNCLKSALFLLDFMLKKLSSLPKRNYEEHIENVENVGMLAIILTICYIMIMFFLIPFIIVYQNHLKLSDGSTFSVSLLSFILSYLFQTNLLHSYVHSLIL